MKEELLKILVCPECKGGLDLKDTMIENNEIEKGRLICKSCGAEYSVLDYIPRFVKNDKYVDNFSFEWTLHRKTQLDSFSGTDESDNSFKERTGFDPESLKDKLVLDVGCGSGRYSEVAGKYGATVIGVDLSYSVDAAFANLGFKKNINIVQADVFALPFRDGIFDYIFSIGVLHHTPSTQKAFKCLPKLLKPGGEIAIWVYPNEGFNTRVYNKISDFYRLFTTKLPKKLLYRIAYVSLPLYYLKKIKPLTSFGYLVFPASDHPDREWRVLDTFDWYSPKYQWKHTYHELASWFKGSGLTEIKALGVPVAMKGVKRR